ncbi:MAG: CAAX prenyl protease-related protein [Verrucomicrobia bacterium]|nr:MAG: CAAX prenyl protease-related protein [Verrucomicrobiota bacterium]
MGNSAGQPMAGFKQRLARSPEFARIAPFAVYAVLGFFQGELGAESRYWFYIAKTFIGAWMVWTVRPYVQEMRWKLSWEAVVVGVAIFAVWVGLDGLYPRLSKLDAGANPFEQFGAGSAVAWFYIVVHIGGMTIIVPPVEEIFYRSMLYRYFVKLDFLSMPLGRFHALSFVVTSVIFGLMHPDRWLAGIICGVAYQGLVVRKNRLGDAMTAHAVTNLMLGCWIVWRHQWSFW